MTEIQNIQKLKSNIDVYKGLLSSISEEDALWRPEPQKWCLLEIVCHMYDEEREDFRPRIKSILDNPSTPLPPFNPEAWVKDRNYIEQDFLQVRDNFLAERQKSLSWLNSLENPNWQNANIHPEAGSRSASYFLSNWVAHDYLHIRQILKLKFMNLQNTSGHPLQYAGKW